MYSTHIVISCTSIRLHVVLLSQVLWQQLIIKDQAAAYYYLPLQEAFRSQYLLSSVKV